MAVPITKKIQTILKLFTEPKVLSALLSLRISGYFVSIGWFNAFKSAKAIDQNENPIPWTTYPFIDFISERLTNNMKIFEYGSGYSTLYFAKRVSSLTSIEHDQKWYNIIKSMIPSGVQLILKSGESIDSYVYSIRDSDEKYHIIFIDSLFRTECISESVQHLDEEGIIVLDDSEREEYQFGVQHLLKNGFKKIDFWGISPGYLYKKCTTVFYKNSNCLGI